MMDWVFKLAPWVSAVVAFMAYRFARKKSQEDRRYADRSLGYEIRFYRPNSSRKISTPVVTVDFCNRDTRTITAKEAFWTMSGSSMTWEVDIVHEIKKTANELMPLKLGSSDFVSVQINPDRILYLPWLNSDLSLLTKAEHIGRLRLLIKLSTGESLRFKIGPVVQNYLLDREVASGWKRWLASAVTLRFA